MDESRKQAGILIVHYPLMFFKDGKSTALLNVFAEGVQFYWQVRREGLEFKRQVTPTLYPQEGYHFKWYTIYWRTMGSASITSRFLDSWLKDDWIVI